MKRLIVLILATCLLSQSLLVSARAQTNTAGTIEQIRAGIAALEKLERSGIATGEVAALNHDFLTGKRKQLREALKRRETALLEYQLVASASLSESEQKAVQASLANVRMELRGLDALIADAASVEGEKAADARARDAEPAPVVATGWRRAAAETSTETSAAVEPAPQDGVANACPGCLPDPQPDEKKDFIISVRTGETRGKTRFGRTDRARIIVVDKNPFLYEYRVTIKANPILEPAIAAFFGNGFFFADEVKEKKEDEKKASGGKKAVAACDALTNIEAANTTLDDDDDASKPGSLRSLYAEHKRVYNETEGEFKKAQDVLYNRNSSCPALCNTATNIRATLQAYRPNLDELNKRITRFKNRAALIQDDVSQLQQTGGLTGECAHRLGELARLARDYVRIGDDFEKGAATITAGKKTFDVAVKTINDVFADPNAFSQVYTRGPFSTPTDVEVTVEQRDLSNKDSKFTQVGQTETINFGGGARFAIAGGVVASPFETITYKRVPAIIDGRSTTIIGAENSSNSRILPILMLHGRLFELNSKYVSGVHLSLGITAKPNDTATNVEWLVGPSISFIEERLFLTVGGYAGRRQQLEGNLRPGQELPADFKDDIPVNNHLVWKPGFALTYKFK
jgi:hypothetical protein